MSSHTLAAAGFVGRDAECKYTPAGVAVMNFPLAVDIGYGDHKGTLWLRIAYWGERAVNLAPHVTKGKLMWVTGELGQPRTFQGRDGETRVSLDMRADTVRFLSAKGDAGQASEGESGGDDETEVPF